MTAPAMSNAPANGNAPAAGTTPAGGAPASGGLTARALINGVETDVTLVAPPAGYMPRGDFETVFSSELARRTASIRESLRRELAADPAFLEEVRRTAPKNGNGANGGNGEPPALTDAQIAQLRASWEKEALEPVRTQAKESETEATRLRHDALRSSLVASLKGKVRDSLLAAPREDADPLIVTMLAPLFAYDRKHGWVVKNASGDGYEYATRPTEARPYKSAAEFVTEWLGRKENADFLVPQSQNGPGLKSGGDVSGGVVTIRRADARIKSKWDAAEAQAKAINGRVEIVD